MPTEKLTENDSEEEQLPKKHKKKKAKKSREQNDEDEKSQSLDAESPNDTVESESSHSKKKKKKKDRKRESQEEEDGEPESKEPRTEKISEADEESNADSACKAGSSAQDTVPQVHSANNWEAVDMGDESRKAKFLRLMGGAKKEGPQGKISTEEKPANAKRMADPNLESALESQYKTTMSNHLKMRDARHRGLGFQGGSSATLGWGYEDTGPKWKKAEGEQDLPPNHDMKKDPKVHFISADHEKSLDL